MKAIYEQPTLSILKINTQDLLALSGEGDDYINDPYEAFGRFA